MIVVVVLGSLMVLDTKIVVLYLLDYVLEFLLVTPVTKPALSLVSMCALLITFFTLLPHYSLLMPWFVGSCVSTSNFIRGAVDWWVEVMVLSVQRDLERVRGVLKALAERADCGELTGFSHWTVRGWVETLDRVLRRYRKEAVRVGRYYRQ